MTNLLKETEYKLAERKYTLKDIAWGCIQNKLFSADEFIEVAKKIDYDSGFGAQEINPTLQLTLTDGTMLIREEYDGSEWWRFVSHPHKDRLSPITTQNLYSKYRWDYPDDDGVIRPTTSN